MNSFKSITPRDFKDFLGNGENKERMINLFQQFIEENHVAILQEIKSAVMYYSKDGKCTLIDSEGSREFQSLTSDQEEADTKVVLHSYFALNQDQKNVILASHSADTDIIVLMAAHLKSQYGHRIFIINGSGTNKIKFWLKDLSIDDSQSRAIIGMHAFSGNDYVSSFFRKGKKKCWQVMIQYSQESAFEELGNDWDISQQLREELEIYVCRLYGCDEKDVNVVRWNLHNKKFVRQNKSIDLASLLPCQQVLNIHIERANYVARIWKLSLQRMINVPSFIGRGWNNFGEVDWITQEFPDEMEEIFFDPAYNDDENMFEDENSSEEEDSDDE